MGKESIWNGWFGGCFVFVLICGCFVNVDVYGYI